MQWKVNGVTLQQDDTLPADADNSAVTALMNLAATQLTTRDGKNPIYAVARAHGILKFLTTVMFDVDEKNVIFEKAVLEGMELANVYSSHFGKKVAGQYWLELYSDDPRTGGAGLLGERHPVYMIDIAGTGEIVNISDVDIDITSVAGDSLKFVGLWDEEVDGSLIDVGEFQVALDLEGRSELCFSAGGVRSSVRAS